MNAAGGYPQASPPALPVEPRALARRWLFALGILGLECWVLAALAPRVRHGLWGASDLVLLLVPLVLLGLGLSAPAGRGASSALLLAFPVSLAASVAARPDFTEHDTWSPLSALLLAGSVAGFLGTALVHLARPPVLRPGEPQLLPPESHQRPSDAARNGRAVLGLVAAVALVATAVLPSWGGRADALVVFGAAADDVTVLSIVIGVLLFAIVLGAVVGPGLRARKRTDARRERAAFRVAPFVALAVLSLLVRLALYWLDVR